MLYNDRLPVKLFYLACYTLCGIIALACCLFYLQYIATPYYQERSTRNFVRQSTLPAPRGTIYDCNGTALATNRPVINLNWQGTGNKRLSHEQQNLYHNLYTLCGFEPTKNLPHVRRAERNGTSTLLAEDLAFTTMGYILEAYGDHPNVQITTSTTRHYPLGTVACHLIGYIRPHISCGTTSTGLEQAFSNHLSGVPGVKTYHVTATGAPTQTVDINEPRTGHDLYTTLDITWQKLAEDVLSDVEAGTIAIMDAQTGDIKAAVSRPTFDPNLFLYRLSHETWNNMQENHPFINRLCQACYPPASLFKLVSLTAGLEENGIDPERTWDCQGYIQYGRRRYHCNRRYTGHGEIDITTALASSCNIPFYEIGKNIAIDTLAEYADMLGLGKKTGLPIPEKQGLVPTREWKYTTHGTVWWPGETLLATIGQTYCLATPLQLACMMNTLCTGYITRPRIISGEPPERTPLALSQATLEFLRNAMKATAQEGTGRMLGKLPNIEILAKTGTAQTSHYSKRKKGKPYLEHAWFIGHAQYKNHNPITIAILLEHVGTARHATKKAKQFLSRYCTLLEKQAEQ